MLRFTTPTMLANLIVTLCAGALFAPAEEVDFRRHAINSDSTYSAAAAIDVNHDGKLDVVAGGFWYEAPSWKPHFVRDVAVIRGRYDGYSHLPIDVNGDGFLDLVNVNYRSRSLYWIQHPGRELGTWKKNMIAEPGPMETGRLVDVDGDGRLDILPNGTTFAAWWELIPGKVATGKTTEPRWIRHNLPSEIAGHGIGIGDVNGDGRDDLVGPRGWLEAPKDRRGQPWHWYPEFTLHRDGSVPMLVVDVDGDHDNDLVWGRAHNVGLYWLEQVRQADGTRRWIKHAIDTSWSQAHALLLADLDGDGQQEVIAGKRYMGHDGKDPGENDPLVVYRYQFDREIRTWRRHLVSWDAGVGFGLDPKVIDMDADGDLDLLASGRSGLFWLENLRLSYPDPNEANFASGRSPPPQYEDHTKLLIFTDNHGKQHPVRTAVDWGRRRADILASMELVMGKLPEPDRRVPLDVKVVATAAGDGYTRHKLTFAPEPEDRVPAYLLVPNDLQEKAPAMLCLHQTTKLGKDEPAGLGGNPHLHYAHHLARQGYVCLVPDYPSLGQYAYDFRAADQYASGSMKAIWNNIRAIDLLETLPEVDADRIGCIGHSLGGHNGLFTAAFDQRIRALVVSCGFTAFGDDDLPSWTGPRYMPRIAERYGNDLQRMPFDFHEVLAAIAPRPVFVCAAKRDRDFAVAGVEKVIASSRQIFRLRSADDRLRVTYPDTPHDFPDQARAEAYACLEKWLKK